MKLFAKVIFTICTLVLIINFPNKIEAEGYTVKPAIFIAADWKNKVSEVQLNTYKTDIIVSLKSVRDYYSKQLSGKTFTIDENIDVVYTNKTTDSADAESTSDFYFKADGEILLPPQEGVVRVIWVFSGFDTLQGGPLGSNIGYAWLTPEHVQGLNPGRDQTTINMNLHILAHELGHAFSVVWAGQAKAHTCSEDTPSECLSSALQPLPKAQESLYDIMNRNTSSLGIYNLNFSNTVYNPEIEKLYKSPFINPEKISAPPPVKPTTAEAQMKIASIAPNPFDVGNILEISGSGLGNVSKIEILKPDTADPSIKIYLSNLQVKEKSENLIKVLIPEDAVRPNTESRWKVRLTAGSFNEVVESAGELTIKGKIEISPTPSLAPGQQVLTVNLATTCGTENTPISAMTSLFNSKNSKAALVKTATGQDGLGKFTYILGDDADGWYYLQAEPLANLPAPEPNTQSAVILDQGKMQNLNNSISFHYPQCPEELPVVATPTPAQSDGTQNIIYTERRWLLISNYQDFRDENDSGDIGSKTMAVKDPKGDTIYWLLSTLSYNNPVYVRELKGIFATDYQVDLKEGQRTNVGGVTIEAKAVQKVSNITKSVSQLNFIDEASGQEDVLVAGEEKNLTLRGEAGKPGKIYLKVNVKYSDNTEDRDRILVFDYRPDPYKCGSSYPQCAGTTGMEDSQKYIPGHEYTVQPYCAQGNGSVVSYVTTDNGEQGSCVLTPTPTTTIVPTETPRPGDPTATPVLSCSQKLTCRYSEAVSTNVCASGVRWVSGTGCEGDNCTKYDGTGCEYDYDCSQTECVPVGNTPTPTPAAGCPAITCSYTENVSTGICGSGIRRVSGTGCEGENCSGCNYVYGCSQVACVPSEPTPTPARSCECTYGQACTTSSGQSGTQACNGVWSGGNCVWDSSGGCSASCTACEADAVPTATPTPAQSCNLTCRYSEYTGSCESGVQWVSGSGCWGDNCSGCNYIYGCSQTECIPPEPTPTPAQDLSCRYFNNGENNCMYSEWDGQCYIGHIDDTSTCNWSGWDNSVCFNPDAGCDYYICGPVQCP